jgi:hypothetical protein
MAVEERRGARKGTRGGVLKGQLRVHDPFELIRWLALSQPDPRKAVSELVQNSLDAGARSVRLVRVRERGVPTLKVLDDGEGVIPELDRSEALRYVATHIGHSRKRSLSPQERLVLMTQGQYGIGLLGFWSLGERLEIRTSLPGQQAQRLILYRDRPDFVIEPLRGRLALEERFTEVVVSGLHREAMGALVGRRIADYLAAELRGQLLSRGVDLVVVDRMTRGLGQKTVAVKPPRFLGERLEGIAALEVPRHGAARLEVYVASRSDEEAAGAGIALYAAGTLVAESFRELAPIGLDHEPWTDRRLTGLVDFPGLSVSPGNRRGVVPDEAAGAFASALARVEPVLAGVLAALERRRAEELDRNLVRDLQRAFRDFFRQRPQYTMLPVQTGEPAAPGAGAAPSAPGVEAPLDADSEVEASAEDAAPLLFPPGPLAEVRLTPSPLRVECRGSRRARARALDAQGRALEEDVAYEFSLQGDVGSLTEVSGSAGRVLLLAADAPVDGVLSVVARAGGLSARAEARVEVVESIEPAAGEGIPQPELVEDGGAAWRSRVVEGKWHVNSGHREYRAIADRPQLKLRYLALLFAKEIVLRSAQDPRLEQPLEQLVEVAAYADRKLASPRGRRSK